MKRDGFTIIELLCALAIMTVVGLFAYKLYVPLTSFFQHSQTHQQTTLDARGAMDFIAHALEAGKASTVNITTAPGSTIPNSQINFALASRLTSGTTSYTFYLSNRTIQMQQFPSAGQNAIIQQIASNVSALMFACDSGAASVIYVSLRMDPPADASGNTVPPLFVLNQEIHMVTNP